MEKQQIVTWKIVYANDQLRKDSFSEIQELLREYEGVFQAAVRHFYRRELYGYFRNLPIKEKLNLVWIQMRETSLKKYKHDTIELIWKSIREKIVR